MSYLIQNKLASLFDFSARIQGSVEESVIAIQFD